MAVKWKIEQLAFARRASKLVSSAEQRQAVSLFRYPCNNIRFPGKGEGDDGDVLDFLDIAYHSTGVRDALRKANSQSLTKAQGRMSKNNTRHGSKSVLAMGAGEEPRVSLWALPYRFDVITIYEFVSNRLKNVYDVNVVRKYNDRTVW